MSAIEPALARTLDHVARDCSDLADPWWLIGSAAARLIGLATPVRDLDLLVSPRDADRLVERWRLAPFTPEPSPLFRSALFARRTDTAVPIELMADFHVRGVPLVPESRLRLPWGGAALFVPDAADQIAICRRFGRPKDLARAERLEALASATPGKDKRLRT